ncbi:MAG: amidohydrolase [Acidobacteria bacterium]|nr:amidohydrolase [Acidobacteriota bacterium]
MIRGPRIDIHAHFYPETFLQALHEEGESFGIRVRRSHPEGPVIEMKGGSLGPLKPAFIDLDRRRKEMRHQGVDVHALSLTRPMIYWADGALGLKLAQVMNDALVEAHRAFPDQFLGLAILPMQNTRLALQELERVSQLPGMRGIYMGTNIHGRNLSDPDFLPLFQRIAELQLPIFLHPIQVLGVERLKGYFLYNLLGFPFETAVAAAHFVFGGILDRFPRLQVCLPHAGGAMPYLVGRMNRGYQISQECRLAKHKPSTYLRRFAYDTISHDSGALLYLIRLVGADRIMLGSDYCFEIGYNRPVEVVTRLASLSRADQAKILGLNAASLLKSR